MEKSLLSFIWAHSSRQQLALVLATLLQFPLLYLTLEIPKRIINDAIGSTSAIVTMLGVSMTQTTFLVGLCAVFLGSVIAHGVLKMRVNTFKGVIAERLLQKFRYTLIGRTLRFPRSYQRRLSEGELVSMITGEAEPLGGIMGDVIANPLLQAGQMATILLFLFIQNLWFGLAAVALIPLQAWLIPRLQKQINVLNRSRIQQVRALAGDIGEVAAGSATLRQHGGWGTRMEQIGARLSGLFETRFAIYRKKFFMKFVNNLLTQLTPFFYFLVGGLLVINGQLSIGALVAALSAFKDLSNPWKELLAYYTAVQEVSQRYHLVIARFAPSDLFPDFLNEKPAETAEATVSAAPGTADVELRGVTVQDETGRALLNGIDLKIEAGSWTYVLARDEEDRSAFAQALAREVSPSKGEIVVDGKNLNGFSQRDVAAHVGLVTSNPFIFAGTLGENVMVPLHNLNGGPHGDDAGRDQADGDPGGTGELDRAHDDWLRLVQVHGVGKTLLARALDRPLDGEGNARLCDALMSARDPVLERLQVRGLLRHVQSFAADTYLDELTLPENLLLAVSDRDGWMDAADMQRCSDLLEAVGLRATVLAQSVTLAETLIEAFGTETAGSAVYRRLGLPAGMLDQMRAVLLKRDAKASARRRRQAKDDLLILSLAFNVPAVEFDRIFSAEVKSAVVAARADAARHVDPILTAGFVPLSRSVWNPQIKVFENMIFGKVVQTARSHRDDIKAVVVDYVAAQFDAPMLSHLVRDLPTSLRGTNLSPQLIEHIGFSQGVIKHPAIVILDCAMASFDAPARNRSFDALREILPDATVIQLESEPPVAAFHDRQLELVKGRIGSIGQAAEDDGSTAEPSDLRRKLHALRKAPLFRELSGQQMRMLAFSARWVEFAAGTYVFRKNDMPDGAFLIYAGSVELIERTDSGAAAFTILPPEGTLVGELGLIRNDPRRLDMRAKSDVTLLRIDAGDFLSVLETDARTAFKLIQFLVGYLDRPK